MMNGAMLRGGPQPMAQPAAAPGPSGADLRGGPPQAPQGPDLGPLAPVFEAAAAAGIQFDPQEAMQNPAAMQAIFDAAAQTDFGATDGGAEHLDGLAQQLGLESPFRGMGEQQQAPPQNRGGGPGSSLGRPEEILRQFDQTRGRR